MPVTTAMPILMIILMPLVLRDMTPLPFSLVTIKMGLVRVRSAINDPFVVFENVFRHVWFEDFWVD